MSLSHSYLEIIGKDTGVVQSQLQKKNFNSIFNDPVIGVDFQQALLSRVSFHAIVSDCCFINAHIEQTKFMKPVTGFTCFSGANLDETLFSEPCENTVIFIGSNLSAQKPIGGIQTVSDFKTALDENQYSIEQIHKLYAIFMLAHEQISQVLMTYTHVPYPINENHLDHLNQAKCLLVQYLPRNKMTRS